MFVVVVAWAVSGVVVVAGAGMVVVGVAGAGMVVGVADKHGEVMERNAPGNCEA